MPDRTPATDTTVRTCTGCYDSWSGPWCDNCDQWPCICLDDPNPTTAKEAPDAR